MRLQWFSPVFVFCFIFVRFFSFFGFDSLHSASFCVDQFSLIGAFSPFFGRLLFSSFVRSFFSISKFSTVMNHLITGLFASQLLIFSFRFVCIKHFIIKFDSIQFAHSKWLRFFLMNGPFKLKKVTFGNAIMIGNNFGKWLVWIASHHKISLICMTVKKKTLKNWHFWFSTLKSMDKFNGEFSVNLQTNTDNGD